MKLTTFGQVSNLIAEIALDKHIPFAQAVELVAENLERARQFDSPDLHLKEASK